MDVLPMRVTIMRPLIAGSSLIFLLILPPWFFLVNDEPASETSHSQVQVEKTVFFVSYSLQFVWLLFYVM